MAKFIEKCRIFPYICRKLKFKKMGLRFFNEDSFIELDELYPTL